MTDLQNELKGQPFISQESDGAERSCNICVLGTEERETGGIPSFVYKRCSSEEARKLFKDNLMTTKLEGKEIAQYCPHFKDCLEENSMY